MGFSNMFDYGQPQAAVAVGTTPGFVAAVETFKESRQVFPGNADAIIVDDNAQLTGLLSLADRNRVTSPSPAHLVSSSHNGFLIII
jgi:hypothetical protein